MKNSISIANARRALHLVLMGASVELESQGVNEKGLGENWTKNQHRALVRTLQHELDKWK